VRYGGLVSRGLALIADAAVLALLIAGTEWVVEQLAQQIVGFSLSGRGRCDQFTEWWRFQTLVCRVLPLVGPVTALTLPPLYQVGFWTLGGRTPGMALMGLRVLRADGRPVGFPTAVVRFLGYLLCFATFLLGFLLVLGSARRQGLHDRLARTVVVHDRLQRAQAPEAPPPIARRAESGDARGQST